MFGYVVASIEDLDQAEKARYHAVYCGLCRTLGQRYGQQSRLALTYDMAFLALVLGSLYEPEEAAGEKRCVTHPLQQHAFVRSWSIDYAADATIILAYHKAMDDWADDRKVSARVYAGWLRSAYRKAAARLPHAAQAVEQGMAAIRQVEESQDPSPDQAANLFGALLGQVFAAKDDHWAGDLRKLGARLGKFVYVMDAVMDFDQDKESGSYNPLVLLDVPRSQQQEMLRTCIALATESFEKLPLERDLHLMRSVLYAGVWQQYHVRFEGEAATAPASGVE